MHQLLKRTKERFLALVRNINTAMVSYRGPGQDGGVSSTLRTFADDHQGRISHWLFLKGNDFSIRSAKDFAKIQRQSDDVLNGHYHFCNEFVWPIVHGQGDKASFDVRDFAHYRMFNEQAANILQTLDCTEFLVHDYQLALLPMLLKIKCPAKRVVVFWHIPWPAEIETEFCEPMIELALSLAHADRLGFHTAEYRDNFVRFVRGFNPDYDPTKTVVAPLGLDIESWESAAQNRFDPQNEWFAGRPYVLSVDRADYTKGVLERLYAIGRFFDDHPEWKEKIVFAQLSTRTREGLPFFDQYWEDCMVAAAAINSMHATEFWTPVEWLPVGLEKGMLAALYRDAKIMLVNPLKDGLNLTAKEFVICQSNHPGILMLSKGAGVYQELEDCVITVNPENTWQFSEKIATALRMPDKDRYAKGYLAQAIVRRNTLDYWWKLVSDPLFENEQKQKKSGLEEVTI